MRPKNYFRLSYRATLPLVQVYDRKKFRAYLQSCNFLQGDAMKKYWIAVAVVVLIAGIAAYNYTSADRSAANSTQTSTSAPSPQSAPSQAPAQDQVNAGFPFKDTSMLKPPTGAKVAIIEFEDLECPGCAYAAPIVHATAARYKIPLVRHDYPWAFHIWSFDAAVTARYLQDKVSPQIADDFRRDVFAGQQRIANKDDLTTFTHNWFQSHKLTLPFVMDASGACKAEVEADRALGDRLNVRSTPCIIVVTETGWTPIAKVSQLDEVIDQALAQTGSPAAASLVAPYTPSRGNSTGFSFS
jgi:protein-disulfide isomerase